MTPAPLAFLNGQFLPYAEAALPFHDAGLVFGATLTDFCRTFRRRLFRWGDHLARFRRDCLDCFISLPYTDGELTAFAEQLLDQHFARSAPGSELALLSFATPGEIGYLVGEPGGAGDRPPTVGMHTVPLNRGRYRRFFTEGADLAIVHHGNPENDRLPAPRTKHRSRLHWFLAGRRIQTDPLYAAGTIPLLADSQGRVLDTAIGSFLIVRDGVVCHPRRDWIVDSVSLRVVEELCSSLGIPFEESALFPEDCAAAQEAFLCGSAFCLGRVRSLAVGPGESLRFNQAGPVYERLLQGWSDLAGVDIRDDFLSSS